VSDRPVAISDEAMAVLFDLAGRSTRVTEPGSSRLWSRSSTAMPRSMSACGIEVTRLTLEVCGTRRDEIAHWTQAVTALAGSAAEQRFALYPEDVLAMTRRSVWATDRRYAEHWWGQTAVVALPIIALEMIGLVFPRRRGS
jgi:hypothetical protein